MEPPVSVLCKFCNGSALSVCRTNVSPPRRVPSLPLSLSLSPLLTLALPSPPFPPALSLLSYFGGNTHYGIDKLVTLNWRTYNGNSSDKGSGSVFTTAISFVVRLFPIVSVSAAYALYADTLGSSIRPLLPKCATSCCSPRALKITCRWVSSMIPMIGALNMTNISLILNMCGIVGLNLVFFMPAILQIVSKRRVLAIWGGKFGNLAPKLKREQFNGLTRTPYSWHFSHDGYAYGIMVVAFVALGFTVYNLVVPPAS